MLKLLLSIVAFFVASYYVKAYLERMDIPKGMTRGMLIFTVALAFSYLVAAIVGWVVG